MTNKEKKDLLTQFTDISSRVDELINERKYWTDVATRISPNYSDMPKAKGNDKIQNAVENIILTEEKIDNEINLLCEFREKIQKAIDGLQDYNLQRIIALRYIGERGYDGKLHIIKLEDIADKMCYSFDRIRHLHIIALQKLEFD